MLVAVAAAADPVRSPFQIVVPVMEAVDSFANAIPCRQRLATSLDCHSASLDAGRPAYLEAGLVAAAVVWAAPSAAAVADSRVEVAPARPNPPEGHEISKMR